MRNESRTASMTVRRQILHLLGHYDLTAREISRIMGIREKEVYEHLPHLEKTLGNGAELISEPARCLHCDFVFKKRRRFTTPGRCPVCRSESISPPVYHVRYRKGKGNDHAEIGDD